MPLVRGSSGPASMRHVFVETDWLVAYAAPAHHKIPEAVELLSRASAGEIRLYLPSICISEARRPLNEKFQSRSAADRVRDFLRWAKREQLINSSEEENTRRVLDKMESRIKTDLSILDNVFASLKDEAGLEIFDLNQEMLVRCTELSYFKLELGPFDQAILAAVLVGAEEIAKAGASDIAFCELDSVLQPWGRSGPRKEKLTKLYDDALIWVYGDFLLANPEMPANWPHRA